MTLGYAARIVLDQSGNPEALAVVCEAMEALDLPVESASPSPYKVRWFSSIGSVVIRGTTSSVFIGDLLLGEFDEQDRDRGRRNVLAVTVAKSGVHLGRLAAAFGIGEEYLRRLRRKEETDGIAGVLLPRQGKVSKVTPAQRVAWHAQFEAGVKPINVFREQPRRGRLSFSTVWRVFEQWQQVRTVRPVPPPAPAPAIASDGQLTLWPAITAGAPVEDGATGEEDEPAITPMVAQPVRSGKLVQHAGTWLMLALAKQLGLYEEAQHALGGRGDGLRIALDAVVCALAIQQRCVEGVRRLATPTGPTLLRAERVPTASGVRKLFGRLLSRSGSAVALDVRMAERFIAAARADDGPAVFYVDNHLRPYTGKHVVRKGWRMQDRRVLPGTTDYYVHDEDGRPVFRIAVPSHDSLVAHLLPVAKRLREALGPDERILLAFDRAGAHAEPLAALRDAGFEWVTYERKPYPELPTTAFSPTTIDGEVLELHESRLRNLGAGRGRVRRIAIRTADARQVNFLASSQASAEQVVAIMGNRWRQENGFKHGVERWGINQLDGRSVESYPPDTIIPNPARSRLERALRVARIAEGDARRELARLAAGSDRYARAEEDLAEALERQAELEGLRPWIPKHAPVSKTELADTLVHHDTAYKTAIDVIRIVCANAESDLAAMLAPHLTKPREAKKVIANLLVAPGKIAVTRDAIHVRLAPAANVAERRAIKQLFATINRRNLTLPGDRHALPLRLDLHLS